MSEQTVNSHVVDPTWDQVPSDWRTAEAADYGQDETDLVKAAEERRRAEQAAANKARAEEERYWAVLAASRPLGAMIGERAFQSVRGSQNPITEATHVSFNQ